jgi:hypothetical protein
VDLDEILSQDNQSTVKINVWRLVTKKGIEDSDDRGYVAPTRWEIQIDNPLLYLSGGGVRLEEIPIEGNDDALIRTGEAQDFVIGQFPKSESEEGGYIKGKGDGEMAGDLWREIRIEEKLGH